MFPSEIPETYYVKGKNGGNATGKLRNQYLNIRTDLAKVDLIQRKPRTKQKESSAECVEILEEDVEQAFELLQSTDIEDFDRVKTAWEKTKPKRQADHAILNSAEYFEKFPILSTGAGYLLVSFKSFDDNLIMHHTYFKARTGY